MTGLFLVLALTGIAVNVWLDLWGDRRGDQKRAQPGVTTTKQGDRRQVKRCHRRN